MITMDISVMTILLIFTCCTAHVDQEQTDYQYYDIDHSDTSELNPLIAVTDEESLHYGSRVAYLNFQGDTIIGFGKFAYFGTDTLHFFANVIEVRNDGAYGRMMGIDRNARILFDLVIFDNGPDYFNEGLTRVQRNQKMGYANKQGEVVIPCQYAFAKWFENGKAEVTMEAKQYRDTDEHLRVESDSWFLIDRKGNRIKAP